MPASEFKSSCFNSVYGLKRKASVEDAVEVWDSGIKCEDGPKRLCNWQNVHQRLPVQQTPSSMQQTTDVFTSNVNNNNSLLMTDQPQPAECNLTEEMNHNSPMVQDQQQLYEQKHRLKNPAVSDVLSQQPPRIPSPWPSQHPFPSLPSHMDQHIMDLNEGTYSADSSEMEVACSTMETDCTPNPEQYHPASSHHQQQQQQHSPNTEFCKNFCGVGEISPNSGRVRCYCKPSWEGMIDMKPYISDVY